MYEYRRPFASANKGGVDASETPALYAKRIGLLFPILVALSAAPRARSGDGPEPIPDTGLVEKTGVELILIDIEATDKDGSPLRGLKKEDFQVKLNYRSWPIYSVDDLCGCPPASQSGPASPEGVGAQAPEGEKASSVPPAAPPLRPAAEPLKFVLYLDYAELQQDGRVHAVEAAQTWIRSTMRPEDETMLAAYSDQAGLLILADFTSDKDKLLAEAARSYADPKLVDPFPVALPIRIRLCEDCCRTLCADCELCWKRAARDEWRQSKHAFEALELLFERLQGVPGRKVLMLFNQNGTMFPARYYPVDEDRIGDHVSLVDRVAAEATLARTRIYTANAGETSNGDARNLGANLADFTGGGYNRELSGLEELIASAGRGCACTYRIGLTPPEGGHDQIFRLTVAVRDRRLPGTYRVQYLSDSERWMRSARAQLTAPERARDVALRAAIVPVARREDGWELELEVGVDGNALQLLPAGPRHKGSWEVGALLSDRRRSWEMLGVSELLRETDRPGAPTILHVRRLDGLRAGAYELRAFVRDRVTNLYGGALAAIELPTGEVGTVGPVVRLAEGRLVRTTLPLRTKERSIEPGIVRTVETGSVPIGNGPVRAGEPLEFASWLCMGNKNETLQQAQRFVTQGNEALFRFEAPSIRSAGNCVQLTDRLETSALAAGSYTYHLRFIPAPGAAPAEIEAGFEIDVGQAADEPQPLRSDPPGG